MLRRFSLYGFLKNQQYHEPFLLLALLQMGLSFFQIGLLVAVREVVVNLMEIPSGAIADLAGRRRSMVFSFLAYIVSFLLMGSIGIAVTSVNGEPANHFFTFPLLAIAFVFYGIGDAFRTGTHKAMIFSWLRSQNRINERTRIYGYTRSWSKIGSAVSVLLAAVFVFISDNYTYIFFFSIIPYTLNIVNFLGYPDTLDRKSDSKTSISEVFAHLRSTITFSIRTAPLRRLIFESMGYEGYFKSVKDYLQPILKTLAITYFAIHIQHLGFSEIQQSSLLIGPVFFILFLLSALASRNAHLLVKQQGHEDATAKLLWGALAITFLLLIPSLYLGFQLLTVACFIVLYCLQNLWRPVLISRFDSFADEFRGATVLSVESQAKSVSTMIISPLLGYTIDWVNLHNTTGIPAREFWPIGVIGFLLALLFFLSSPSRERHNSHLTG